MKRLFVRNIGVTECRAGERLGALGTATVHEAYGRIGL